MAKYLLVSDYSVTSFIVEVADDDPRGASEVAHDSFYNAENVVRHICDGEHSHTECGLQFFDNIEDVEMETEVA